MKIYHFSLYMLLFTTICCNSGNAQNDSLFGVWKVTKCISDDYTQPMISSEEQLREIGKTVIITQERLIISFKDFSDTCLNPSIKVSNVDVNKYFHNQKKMIHWLGFRNKQKIDIINTNCESFWFKRFFHPEKDILIIHAEGFFYYLKKEMTTDKTIAGRVN